MKFVPNALSRAIARQGLQTQKNAPNILFAVGVAGMVGSTVLACRATLKLEETLEVTARDMEQHKIMRRDEPDQYSESEMRKDIALDCAKGAAKVSKLYAPAVILGTASIGALTKSHNMLQERNMALAAAYGAVDEAFRRYRERVVEKYGSEQDQEFRYATEPVEVVDEETGKLTTETRISRDELPSQYAKFFDQLCGPWDPNPEYNLAFLRNQQNYWNDILRSRGHVFLNEVYAELGMPHTKAGSVVGWVMTKKGVGDNFIDFNIWDGMSSSRNFVNGREGAILLDFNVDGVIFDLIENPEEKIGWQS